MLKKEAVRSAHIIWAIMRNSHALRELIPFYKEKMEKAEEKFLAMKKIYTTLLGMFADEMKQEELEKDECYGCAYGKCGPCIGICYKSMKA